MTSMRRFSSIYWYAGGAVIVLVLVLLTWWYFVLRGEINTIANDDALRGSGIEAPTFGSRAGSTYENIVSSAASIIRGDSNEVAQKLPRLAQISKTPTAGMGFVGIGSAARLRFVERATGYILESELSGGVLERLTNTLAPRTYEAIVSEKNIAMQALEEDGRITTVVGSLSASTTAGSNSFSPKRLPDGIRSIALDPSRGEAVFVSAVDGGASAIVRTDIASGKQTQLYTSSLSGWRIHLLLNGRVILQTNAADGAAGYAYELKAGSLVPIVRNLRGLTILPHPSLPALLFSNTENGSTLFARLDERFAVVSLPVRTIPEKCVWSPGEKLVAYCAVPAQSPSIDFLDAWYRGEVHTSDAWWRIDVSANTAGLVYSGGNSPFDVERPTIDKSGNYIAFLNARNKSLWMLRIEDSL